MESTELWALTGLHVPDLPLPLVCCPFSVRPGLLHRGLYLSIQVGFEMHMGICYSHECQDECQS